MSVFQTAGISAVFFTGKPVFPQNNSGALELNQDMKSAKLAFLRQKAN
jgi:hypothetical protein